MSQNNYSQSVLGLTASISYLGLNTSGEWSHFAWSININGQVFEYKTGLGHSSAKRKGERGDGSEFGLDLHGLSKEQRIELSHAQGGKTLWDLERLNVFVQIPKIEHVLHALFLDSQSGENNTFESFCSDLGYDNDSRKALDIYLACQANAAKLRKALGSKFSEVQSHIETLDL